MYRYLVRYLLGSLSDEDTELIDWAVISNEDFAALLCLVETDLVDAYARDALSGEVRERFEDVYLASPLRRNRVRFAGQFLRLTAAAPGPTVS